MGSYRGLTWDHPRGFRALEAAAARLDRDRDGLTIVWDRQPLEGFESHPVADLCDRYDLVVLDHPHVGEAVEADCLIPLEEVFPAAFLDEIAAATIGPCFESYGMSGRHWALPLDAAAQVMASRPDLLAEPPETWDDVAEVAARTGGVALSLAGPHAILTLLSMAAALAEAPAEPDDEALVPSDAGCEAWERLRELVAHASGVVRDLNPIGILDHIAGSDDVILCPLIFGYVPYAAPSRDRRLRFTDAPRAAPGGRPGSILGGTGIGLSRRCPVSPELLRHLTWLMSAEAQTRFIPAHDGQPSRRSAWHDAAVNAAWGDFYRGTADTLEAARVRPRHSGYVAFQTRASALLREALDAGMPARRLIETLQDLYRASRAPARAMRTPA